jgi:hypothetical protein
MTSPKAAPVVEVATPSLSHAVSQDRASHFNRILGTCDFPATLEAKAPYQSTPNE